MSTIRLTKRRLIGAGVAALAVACVASGVIAIAPRFWIGEIEGVQWFGAMVSMAFGIPVGLYGLVGAAGGYAMAIHLQIEHRMPAAAIVGGGAVTGVGALIAMGSTWADQVDGVSVASIAIGGLAFLVGAIAYLVAARRPVASAVAF